MLVPAATSIGNAVLLEPADDADVRDAARAAAAERHAHRAPRRQTRDARRRVSCGPSTPVLVLAARWSGAAHDTAHMIVVHSPAIRIQSLRIVRHTFRVWPSWPSHLDGEVQRENAEGLPSGHGW